MPLYKVWNCSRTVKRAVLASSIEEVKDKGMKKLNCMNGTRTVDVTIVLEEDGTVIDEDEILEEFKAQTLVLIIPGESWAPADRSVNGQDASFQASSAAQTSDIQSAASQPMQTPMPISTQLISPEGKPAASPSRAVLDNTPGSYDIAHALNTAPLPKFSALVEQNLIGANSIPERIWSRMIGEAAHYYAGNWPGIGDQQHYKIIGKMMHRRYPCIGLGGSNPWSAYNKSLSQKIRHIRHDLKVKSCVGKSAEPAEKKCFRQLPFTREQDDGATSEKDVERHIVELKSEWEKPARNRSVTHIKALLKNTRHERVEFLTLTPSGSISPMFGRFPCFADSLFILYEFGLMLGNARLVDVAKNMKKLLFAVESIGDLSGSNDDPLRMLPVVSFIEKRVKFHQGGKNSALPKSVVQVKEDVADEEIQKALVSKECEAPRIIAFISSGVLSGLYIIGDTVVVDVDVKGGIMGALLKLIATYYIFDLNYPKAHSMMLAILQTFVMEEPYKQITTKGFKMLAKEISSKVEQLGSSASMDFGGDHA